jgi:hypothetical protein
MLNQHVTHLATLAKVGTTVRVVASYTGGVNSSAPLSSLFSGFSLGGDDPPKKAANTKRVPARSTATRAASATRPARPN